MRSIYVLYAHPENDKSRANRAKRAAISGVDGIVIRDLYARYPQMIIDGEVERYACDQADVIVYQFPLYWYSTPPILRAWEDEVLTHGWAFGRNARGLKGKPFLVATTIGAPKAGYTAGEKHGATLEELLLPIHQTARFCGMVPLSPNADYGCFDADRVQTDAAARRYRDRLIALRDDKAHEVQLD